MADAAHTTPASRRGFLRLVASAPAAVTAQVAADALSPAMIDALALYRRLGVDNEEAWNALENSDAERGTPEWDRLWADADDTNHAKKEAATKVARTPAATMADVRAKVAEVARLYSYDRDEILGEIGFETSSDSEKLLASVVADLMSLWSVGASS